MTNRPVTDKLKNSQVLPIKVKFTDCSGAPITNLTPAIRLVQARGAAERRGAVAVSDREPRGPDRCRNHLSA